MATKLFTQKVSTGSMGAPVNAKGVRSSITGSMRSAKIDPNAGKIKYTHKDANRIITDTTTAVLAGAAGFADQATKTAFDYQRREADMYAKDALQRFRAENDKLMNGSDDGQGGGTKGYYSTEGRMATDTHQSLQQQVNSNFDSILQDLEPQARQMAMLAMASERDTTLGKAAVHRSQQLKVAEVRQRDQDRKQAVRTMAADPSTIDNPDQYTNMTGKDKFYSAFVDPMKADAAWNDHIVAVGEKIYLDQGYAAAKEFYFGDGKTPGLGQIELSASPSHSNRLQMNVIKWENEAIRSENSSFDLETKQANKVRQQAWDKSENVLAQARAKGEVVPRDQIATMLDAQIIDPAIANTYIKDTYGEIDRASDPGRLRSWMDNLAAASGTGFMLQGESISGAYNKDIGLSNTDRTFLRDYEMKLTNPEYQSKYKRGKEQIDTWLKGQIWEQGLYDQRKETIINQANRELFSRLSAGEGLDDIMVDLDSRYNPVVVAYKELPPLRSNVIDRPTDNASLGDAMDAAKTKYNTGTFTYQEYMEQASLLLQYERAMEKGGMLSITEQQSAPPPDLSDIPDTTKDNAATEPKKTSGKRRGGGAK